LFSRLAAAIFALPDDLLATATLFEMSFAFAASEITPSRFLSTR
jgi:hypothetical protein